jgi:hypothetical protein
MQFDEYFFGVFNHDEAKLKSVGQISLSGCGLTAIINVIVAFGFLNIDSINYYDWNKCILRLRSNEAPLAQYLESRSVAGCTGQELVDSMQVLLEINGFPKLEIAKFLSYKEICIETSKNFDLVDCLKSYILSGHKIIATLNLQVSGNDAWHHQMVYGVDTKNRFIYCMNPIDHYTEEYTKICFSTPSCLLIKKKDILDRVDRSGSDTTIFNTSKWKEFNVQEQIEQIKQIDSTENFVVIPASYVGGISIFRS